MKIKNHCKVDIKGLEMGKALLEEHVRYGEARFIDKELVRPFVNRIYQDLAELESVMKPKTCKGCVYGMFGVDNFGMEIECTLAYRCSRGQDDMFKPKDNA